MRFLDSGADPAVPHAHWGFREVVAELVKSAGQEKVDLGDSVGGSSRPAARGSKRASPILRWYYII